MSLTASIVTGVATANGGVSLMARVLGNAAQPITQASLSAISFTVTDLTTGAVIASNVALTVSQVVFNSLVQGDPRWTKDSPQAPGPDGLSGYNFLALLSSTYFATVGDRIEVRVTFTPLVGQPFVQVFRVTLL